MEPLKSGTNLDDLTVSETYTLTNAESPNLPPVVAAGFICGNRADDGWRLELVHPRFIASTHVALDGTITKSPYVSLD